MVCAAAQLHLPLKEALMGGPSSRRSSRTFVRLQHIGSGWDGESVGGVRPGRNTQIGNMARAVKHQILRRPNTAKTSSSRGSHRLISGSAHGHTCKQLHRLIGYLMANTDTRGFGLKFRCRGWTSLVGCQTALPKISWLNLRIYTKLKY